MENDIIADLRLSKSDKYLRSALHLVELEDWNSAISFLYYAAFQTVIARLRQSGITVKSHSNTKKIFVAQFVKTNMIPLCYGQFYARLYRERDKSDHKDFAIFTEEDVLPLVPQTQEFIDVIKRLIHTN